MRKLISLVALLFIPIQDTPPPVVVPFQSTSWKFGPNSGKTQSSVVFAGYGGAFSQDLGVSPSTLQAWPGKPGYYKEGVYTLKFSVANYFPSYPGYYEAKISFGTQELCETTGWAMRNFTQVALTCPSPGYLIVDKALPAGGPAQGQQNLAITFSTQGWTVLFDDVSLEFTPQ